MSLYASQPVQTPLKQKGILNKCNIFTTQRALHGPPKVVRVELPRELGVDVDNVHVALCSVSDDGFVVLPGSLVSFDVDAECAVEFQLQSVGCQYVVFALSR